MALPTFDKKDQIPKGFEDEYEEHEGKWVSIDIVKLKESIDKEREKREAAEGAAKKSAKEATEAKAALDATKAGVTDAQLQKIREDAKAEALKELEPKVKDADAVRAENRTLKLNRVVQDSFATAGVLADRREKLFRLHEGEFDLTADGKPMVKGHPETDVTKHIAALVKSYPEWVEGTKAAGGGAAGVTKAADGAATAGDAILKDPQAGLRAAHEAGATA